MSEFVIIYHFPDAPRAGAKDAAPPFVYSNVVALPKLSVDGSVTRSEE